MKTYPSRPCSHRGCRRKTTDFTGRCHDHRGTPSTTGAPSAVAPPDLTPVLTREMSREGDFVEIYRVNGRRHRKDGPAVIVYYPDGTLKRELYCDQGELHRVDGPASSEFYPDGSPSHVTYYRRGKKSRPGGGPAYTYYREDGSLSSQEWWRQDLRHRLDGPCTVFYNRDGSVKDQWRSFLHVGCSDSARIAELLRERTENEIRILLRESVYREAYDQGVPADTIVDAIGAGVRSPEAIRALAEGAPAEWVRSFEEGRS